MSLRLQQILPNGAIRDILFLIALSLGKCRAHWGISEEEDVCPGVIAGRWDMSRKVTVGTFPCA